MLSRRCAAVRQRRHSLQVQICWLINSQKTDILAYQPMRANLIPAIPRVAASFATCIKVRWIGDIGSDRPATAKPRLAILVSLVALHHCRTGRAEWDCASRATIDWLGQGEN